MERTGRPVKRGRKKVCMFCVDRAEKIDYKDIVKLRKCMTERADRRYQESASPCSSALCCRLKLVETVRVSLKYRILFLFLCASF